MPIFPFEQVTLEFKGCKGGQKGEEKKSLSRKKATVNESHFRFDENKLTLRERRLLYRRKIFSFFGASKIFEPRVVAIWKTGAR